jgi:hypothetical protein
VKLDLTLQDYLAYARSQPSIHTPEGWAFKYYNAHEADDLVREWLDKGGG